MSKDAKATAGTKKPRNFPIIKCCSGYRAQQRTLIMKAKSKAGTKAANHALRMQRIMTLLEKAVVADLTTGISVFKRRIDRDKLEKLLDEGKIDEAMATIPWDNLPEDLERVSGNLERAVVRSSEAAAAALPIPAVSAIVGTANPKVREFISSQVGNLVVDITESSRKSIQSAVTASFDQGLTPRKTARLMQSSVGLTEKQNQRLMLRQTNEFAKRDRLNQRLVGLNNRGLSSSLTARKIKRDLANLSDDQIQRRTERMALQAQKQRSITIARTELTRSVNQGQVETWVAAANEGLIDENTARKVWVVVPDDRLSNICADLDGKSVGLNEKFFVHQTGAMVDGPPAHPNCRSAISLTTEEE